MSDYVPFTIKKDLIKKKKKICNLVKRSLNQLIMNFWLPLTKNTRTLNSRVDLVYPHTERMQMKEHKHDHLIFF